MAAGAAVDRSGWFATPGHVPRLTADQQTFLDAALAAPPEAPLVPVAFAPLALEVRRSKIAGLQAAFDTLLALGTLVRVGEHLYRAEAIAEIHRRLDATLTAEQRMTAARFRDVLGTSRKYAVPLLEYFDRAGVTVRDGDDRLRAPAP